MSNCRSLKLNVSAFDYFPLLSVVADGGQMCVFIELRVKYATYTKTGHIKV